MSEPVPPIMMLRSFLTVASGYIICLIAFVAIVFGLGYAFFPDFVELQNLDLDAQKEVMDNNPEQAISRTMFLAMLVLNFAACFAVGIYVIWTAPFAHYGHVIFLAILMFVYYLQIAIADPPAKKSMTLCYLVLFPTAVLMGGKFGLNRFMRFEEGSGDEPTGELL